MRGVICRKMRLYTKNKFADTKDEEMFEKTSYLCTRNLSKIIKKDCLAVSYICYVLVFKLYLEVFIRLFC